uniref:Uncharacterized protein n=1 Tax=Anguilla anguilla TaxID=7936 RepID=A0A0E9X2P7_ANGAN
MSGFPRAFSGIGTLSRVVWRRILLLSSRNLCPNTPESHASCLLVRTNGLGVHLLWGVKLHFAANSEAAGLAPVCVRRLGFPVSFLERRSGLSVMFLSLLFSVCVFLCYSKMLYS